VLFFLAYQEDFLLFTAKTFAHFSDTSTKAKITPAVSPERYITSKVFVSREGIEPALCPRDINPAIRFVAGVEIHFPNHAQMETLQKHASLTS